MSSYRKLRRTLNVTTSSETALTTAIFLQSTTPCSPRYGCTQSTDTVLVNGDSIKCWLCWGSAWTDRRSFHFACSKIWNLAFPKFLNIQLPVSLPLSGPSTSAWLRLKSRLSIMRHLRIYAILFRVQAEFYTNVQTLWSHSHKPNWWMSNENDCHNQYFWVHVCCRRTH